jgi:hypothetical protein
MVQIAQSIELITVTDPETGYGTNRYRAMLDALRRTVAADAGRVAVEQLVPSDRRHVELPAAGVDVDLFVRANGVEYDALPRDVTGLTSETLLPPVMVADRDIPWHGVVAFDQVVDPARGPEWSAVPHLIVRLTQETPEITSVLARQ